MSSVVPSYQFLWRCLSPDCDVAATASLREQIITLGVAWPEVVGIADREMLSPALYHALGRRDLLDAVPADVGGALKRRFFTNSLLNEKIRRQAEEVVTALNEVDIDPLALKGVLNLFEAAPSDWGARMMRDIDFVVPEARLGVAVEKLRSLGYVENKQNERPLHEYWPMRRPGDVVEVDLHALIGEQRDVLSTEEAWREAVVVPAGELRLLALEPTHRVLHNIFHSQIEDRGFELGVVHTRQLVALAETCIQHGAAIDWQRLWNTVTRRGLGRQYKARIYQAVHLFGVSAPPGFAPGIRAGLHHRRCLLQLRFGNLAKLARLWAGWTHPFKRYQLDLAYGCGTNPFRVNLCRVRHAWHLFRKYRGQILSRMAYVRKTYE